MEINLKTNTLTWKRGNSLTQLPCDRVDIDADVRKRKAAVSDRLNLQKDLPLGGWRDSGFGTLVWRGRDGVNVNGEPFKDGDIWNRAWLDPNWDYSLGRKK
jgi:hypothetical protein